MTRFLPLALSATLLAPACNRKRENAAGEIEALSNDACLQDWLSEAQRKRLVESAKRGDLTSEQVNAYIDDIRAKVRKAEKQNMSNDSFCRLQRNVWRQHFLR